jgi:hypothetical protein
LRCSLIVPVRSSSPPIRFFVEKVRDIAGLYLNPPDHALVLCVDEKSQIQALNRTQPVLPMGLGYVEILGKIARLCSRISRTRH